MGKGVLHLLDTAGTFWKLKWITAGLIRNVWPCTTSVCASVHFCMI